MGKSVFLAYYTLFPILMQQKNVPLCVNFNVGIIIIKNISNMKKTLLTILCAFVSLFGMAQNTKTYSEQLLVTINGETSEPQTTDVTVVDNGDGTINFELKNFILNAGEEVMYVGNICVANIAVKAGEDGLQYFAYDGSIQIQNGDLAGVDMWYGPLLGNIPLNLNGKMNDEKLFVTIDIDMQTVLGQIIHVELGTDDFAKTGDLNGDGKIDIADAVSVLNIMAANEYSKAADVNNDAKIDIADFVSILNIMAAQ